MDLKKRDLVTVGSIWKHYDLGCPVQIASIDYGTDEIVYNFCNSRREESITKFLELFNFVAPDRICEAPALFTGPSLKVVIEGMGGTVYIVTEDHGSQNKGKRGYIAEIGVGEDCWAKNQKEALIIAYKLVDTLSKRS